MSSYRSPSSPKQTPLGALSPGGRGIVVGIDGAEDDSLRCRLLEMGVIPGTSVEVIRVAPLGDPIEIRLRGYALSLRRREANAISLRDVQ